MIDLGWRKSCEHIAWMGSTFLCVCVPRLLHSALFLLLSLLLLFSLLLLLLLVLLLLWLRSALQWCLLRWLLLVLSSSLVMAATPVRCPLVVVQLVASTPTVLLNLLLWFSIADGPRMLATNSTYLLDALKLDLIPFRTRITTSPTTRKLYYYVLLLSGLLDWKKTPQTVRMLNQLNLAWSPISSTMWCLVFSQPSSVQPIPIK